MDDDRELREELGLPPRRRGRKPAVFADTLDGALTALNPRESDFVRHVLAGKQYADAYRLTSDVPIASSTAQTNGLRMASRVLVKHAIALGRKTGAVQAVTGLTYDMAAAVRELDEKIAKAEAAGQFTAVANLMQQKLKVHGLLVDRQQVEQTGFVVSISGVDTSRLVNPPRIIEHQESES